MLPISPLFSFLLLQQRYPQDALPADIVSSVSPSCVKTAPRSESSLSLSFEASIFAAAVIAAVSSQGVIIHTSPYLLYEMISGKLPIFVTLSSMKG